MVILEACEVYNQRNECCPLSDDAGAGRMQWRPSSLGLAVDSNPFSWTKAVNGDKGEYEHNMGKDLEVLNLHLHPGLSMQEPPIATLRFSHLQAFKAFMPQAKSFVRSMQLVNCAVHGTDGKKNFRRRPEALGAK